LQIYFIFFEDNISMLRTFAITVFFDRWVLAGVITIPTTMDIKYKDQYTLQAFNLNLMRFSAKFMVIVHRWPPKLKKHFFFQIGEGVNILVSM
jgi:hypothetical protein